MGQNKYKIHRIGTWVLREGKDLKTNIYRDTQYNFYTKFKGEWHKVRLVQMHKGRYGSAWVLGARL